MSALSEAALTLAEPGQPGRLYQALQAAAQAAVGHKLFTLMVWYQATGEAERVFTSDPKAYPVGGRKALGDSPFGREVLGRQRPYLGRTKADIKWAFFDHELIYSLGLGSVLNIPVRYDGRLLGTMNLLHEEHWYREPDIAAMLPFAALLVPAFRERIGS